MAIGQALLIGINEVNPAGYGGRWDGKLNFCERDATEVAALTARHGFSNSLLLTAEATKPAVVGAIESAAASLRGGDIFLLYYSGHGNTTSDSSGDEADSGNQRDETLCLYDTQLLDDELYALWQQFAPGVRVLVLTDACHSGSVLRSRVDADWVPKAMDRTAREVFKRMNPRLYADIRAGLPAPQPVTASVLLLAGCREDQLSYESKSQRHGRFTAALLEAASSNRSYQDVLSAMCEIMPAKQQPVMAQLGANSQRFMAERAFTVS